MADTVSKKVRSKNMAAIKSKGTKPEIILGTFLRMHGYRCQLHKKSLPGKPDIFIKNTKTAILINGCFWHQHPGCSYAAMPKSNVNFWREKLASNIKRDKLNVKELGHKGCKVITVWECDIKKAARNKKRGRIFNRLLLRLHEYKKKAR